MNEKQYVDAVMGKITCSRRRKQEFQKQLLADIRLRLEEGEELKEIFSQMGTAKEVAAAFQETVPPEETPMPDVPEETVPPEEAPTPDVPEEAPETSVPPVSVGRDDPGAPLA